MDTGPEGRAESRTAERPADLLRIETLATRHLGRAPRRITRIEAGLGERRFYRIELEGGDPATMIARIEPDDVPSGQVGAVAEPGAAPLWLPEPELEPIRSFLERGGLPVPRSYGRDSAQGIDLLEDVGSRSLLTVPASLRRERYLEACALVPRLQALAPEPGNVAAFARVFDMALVRTKAWKLLHWAWPGLLGRNPTDAERKVIEAGFAAIGELMAAAPRRLAHRDFKAENLHRVDRGPRQGEALVMIDVQGAFMAPPEYDLVCLLRDLQIDLDEGLVREAFDATVPALPDRPSHEEASERFEALAVIRLAKDLSHVIQAGRVRGDRRRWHEIPRGLALLEASVGRLEHTFPSARALTSVIHTLTRSARASDIGTPRQGS